MVGMADKDIFEQLNDKEKSLASRKRLLLEHVQEQLEKQKSHPGLSRDIAHDVAGLMATHTAQSLSDGDPLSKALELAGQLELPEEHRSSNASWEALADTVRQLP